MQRITIDDALLTTVDDLSARRGYGSRSEAVRDIVREALVPIRAAGTGSEACYGALSYADAVVTQRGVRYGHLHLMPEGDDARAHPDHAGPG